MMGYLKITTYLYLLFAAFFIYDGITKLQSGEGTPYISFAFAAVGVFMFFFRMKSLKKFDNKNRDK